MGCWTIQQRAVSVRQIRHDSLVCKAERFEQFWVKILKFFDADPGWKNSDPESEIEKSLIRDKHPGSATLDFRKNNRKKDN